MQSCSNSSAWNYHDNPEFASAPLSLPWPTPGVVPHPGVTMMREVPGSQARVIGRGYRRGGGESEQQRESGDGVDAFRSDGFVQKRAGKRGGTEENRWRC